MKLYQFFLIASKMLPFATNCNPFVLLKENIFILSPQPQHFCHGISFTDKDRS